MGQLVGIFGYPLGHSISSVFQQAAFDHLSLAVEYRAWPTPPESLAEEVNKLRGEEYLGANVTVPHKEQVFQYLDDTDIWAKSVGAVNTIVRDGNRLRGYNTDSYGFINSLKEVGGFDPRGKSVLIVGAGGASRAAVFGLADEGIASLTIANRTLGRAQALVEEVQGSISSARAVPMCPAGLENACGTADLIVNSTSMGMLHGDAESGTPLKAEWLPPGVLVYDMVYNPPDTPLLKEARRAGARIVGGLPMLIYQGAAAFELWTGREAPIEVMFHAGEAALAGLSTT